MDVVFLCLLISQALVSGYLFWNDGLNRSSTIPIRPGKAISLGSITVPKSGYVACLEIACNLLAGLLQRTERHVSVNNM